RTRRPNSPATMPTPCLISGNSTTTSGKTTASETFLIAARELADAGRLDEALVWYENAWKAGETDACWLAAERLIDADRLDAALAWYERAADAGRNIALQLAFEELTRAGRLDEASVWSARAAQAGSPSPLQRETPPVRAHLDPTRPTTSASLDETIAALESAAVAGDRTALSQIARRLADAGRWHEAFIACERAAATGSDWDLDLALTILHELNELQALDGSGQTDHSDLAERFRHYGFDPASRHNRVIAEPWDLAPPAPPHTGGG
ncbi:hypothetical protein ACIRPX_45830, partial [Streptomyces sp. NPDC101225]